MFTTGMRYWVWVCEAALGEREFIKPGEFFTLILERLSYIGIAEVLESFQALSNEIDHYSCNLDAVLKRELIKERFSSADSALLANIIEFKTNGEHIKKYVTLLCEKTREDEYAEFKQLSREIFIKLKKAKKLIDALGMDSEPYEHSIHQLKNKCGELIERFQEEILNCHTDYFQNVGYREPINLAHMVFCFDFLKKCVNHSLTNNSEQMEDCKVCLPVRMYKDLLDWDGDYDQIQHAYWQIELREIMGVEDPDLYEDEPF